MARTVNPRRAVVSELRPMRQLLTAVWNRWGRIEPEWVRRQDHVGLPEDSLDHWYGLSADLEIVALRLSKLRAYVEQQIEQRQHH